MWRPNGDFDDALIRENMLLAKALGKPLMRSFPAGFPTEQMYPHLVLLLRCKDVRIAGLSFVRSRSWTINPYACERLNIDGIYIAFEPERSGLGGWHRSRRMQGRAHLQQHHRDRRRRHRVVVVQYLRPGAAVRKHHGDQLPALLGVERAEVLRWKHELHPARDRG